MDGWMGGWQKGHATSPAMPPRLPSTPPVIICQTGKSLLSLMSKLYLRVEVHKCRYFTRSDSDGNVLCGDAPRPQAARV